jgi:hypothetical protein
VPAADSSVCVSDTLAFEGNFAAFECESENEKKNLLKLEQICACRCTCFQLGLV